MAKPRVLERVKRSTARTKKVLAKAEVKTDNFLMRLAASPYTVGILSSVAFCILFIYLVKTFFLVGNV